MPTLAILGAGMAGLSAAQVLSQHPLAQNHLTVLLLDKGRFPGGRMASWTVADGRAWDTGAQYAKVSDPTFERWLRDQLGSALLPWPDPDRQASAGGFRHLAEQAANGLNVSPLVTVEAILWDAASRRWRLTGTHQLAGTKSWWADGVLVTSPVPQALSLLQPYLPPDHGLHQVQYAPNLTLQVNVSQALPVPYRNPQGVVGWAASNHPKWANAETCWTLQSTAAFAEAYFDSADEDIIRRMCDDVACQLSLNLDDIVPVRLKRWRYALVTQAYPLPYYAHPTMPLWIAGDGFAGPRLEAAWQSGQAVARAMLAAYLDPQRH